MNDKYFRKDEEEAKIESRIRVRRDCPKARADGACGAWNIRPADRKRLARPAMDKVKAREQPLSNFH